MYGQGPPATAHYSPATIILVYSSGTIAVNSFTVPQTVVYGGTQSYSCSFQTEDFVLPLLPPRRARRPQQPAEVRLWQPKLVLGQAIASWAASLRAFAGR